MLWPKLIFLTCLCFVAVGHELDAIQQHEWRFFFAKLPIGETAASRLFIFLHVPVYAWLLLVWQNGVFQLGFALFAVGHMVAHFLLRHHPLVNFGSWFSWLWIYGGGLLGGLYLVQRLF